MFTNSASLRRVVRRQQVNRNMRDPMRSVHSAGGGISNLRRHGLRFHVRWVNAEEVPGIGSLRSLDRLLLECRLPG